MTEKCKVQGAKCKVFLLASLSLIALVLLPTTNYQLPTVLAQSCPNQTTNPRVQGGLISTPDIRSSNNKFGNTGGTCAVDSKAAFAPYKLPTYEALKAIYFDQAKESAIVKKQVDEGNVGEGRLSNYLSGGKNLIYIKGFLSMNNSITGSNTAVVFIDGDLYFSSPMTQFTYGNGSSGIVFVVKGNVYIYPSITQIDAVIIAKGKIYTAGAGCSHTPYPITEVSPGVPIQQLIINGSLVSLTENQPIEFCRSLGVNGNSTTAAELINHQSKYLVILKDLFAETLQRWSEIQ